MRRILLLSILLFMTARVAVAQIPIDNPWSRLDPNYPRSLSVPLEGTPFWTTSESNVVTTGMIWRDANNDGFIDAFFSNGNDIELARNFMYQSQTGVLPLSATWYSANAIYSGHCAVGDINDDGWADFVVSNFLGPLKWGDRDHMNLYYNSPSGLSSFPDWYSADSMFSFSCALGDADGDGDLDLAVATGEGYNLELEYDRIYYNVGGQFQSTPGWVSSQTTTAMDVTWGDVNNDGFLDLAFCYDSGPEAVYLNSGGMISTTPVWTSSNNESANTVVFSDVNGDGWLDLIVAYNNQLGGSGHFAVFFNDGTGQLQSTYGWHSATGGYGSAVSVYDYDGDGDDDLAAGRWWDRPRIYENLGDSFTSTPIWQADVATVVEELAWVDADGSDAEERADTIPADGRRVVYTSHHPLYSLDSVVVDGVPLTLDRYCYDLISGWVAMDAVPTTGTEIYYRYSEVCDLAVANWDTVNMVYANTGYVDFYADPTFGWAPLTVQFSDSTAGASSWMYHFGDGDSSALAEPVHAYDEAGSFAVTLENESDFGLRRRTINNMIMVLADTLTFRTDSVFAGSTMVVSVEITNSQPLNMLTIPVQVEDSPMGLELDSVVRGTRTQDFEALDILTYYHGGGVYKLTLHLESGTGGTAPFLSPGEGEVLRLCFSSDRTDLGGLENNVALAATAYPLEVVSPLRNVSYTPAVIPGTVSTINVRRSDCTLDGEIDISDITYLVNYLFILSVGPPPTLQSGDFNADLAIDISDLTATVNYLFLEGPPPVSP